MTLSWLCRESPLLQGFEWSLIQLLRSMSLYMIFLVAPVCFEESPRITYLALLDLRIVEQRLFKVFFGSNEAIPHRTASKGKQKKLRFCVGCTSLGPKRRTYELDT